MNPMFHVYCLNKGPFTILHPFIIYYLFLIHILVYHHPQICLRMFKMFKGRFRVETPIFGVWTSYHPLCLSIFGLWNPLLGEKNHVQAMEFQGNVARVARPARPWLNSWWRCRRFLLPPRRGSHGISPWASMEPGQRRKLSHGTPWFGLMMMMILLLIIIIWGPWCMPMTSESANLINMGFRWRRGLGIEWGYTSKWECNLGRMMRNHQIRGRYPIFRQTPHMWIYHTYTRVCIYIYVCVWWIMVIAEYYYWKKPAFSQQQLFSWIW